MEVDIKNSLRFVLPPTGARCEILGLLVSFTHQNAYTKCPSETEHFGSVSRGSDSDRSTCSVFPPKTQEATVV